jgi:hypothetical protein
MGRSPFNASVLRIKTLGALSEGIGKTWFSAHVRWGEHGHPSMTVDRGLEMNFQLRGCGNRDETPTIQ